MHCGPLAVAVPLAKTSRTSSQHLFHGGQYRTQVGRTRRFDTRFRLGDRPNALVGGTITRVGSKSWDIYKMSVRDTTEFFSSRVTSIQPWEQRAAKVTTILDRNYFHQGQSHLSRLLLWPGCKQRVRP